MRLLLCFVLIALTEQEMVALFRQALEMARCTLKQAYTDMAMSQSDFSEQLNGSEPPRFLCRIWKIQNRQVTRWYAFLLTERLGLPKEVTRGTPIVLALMARKRMARASLDTRKLIQQRREQRRA